MAAGGRSSMALATLAAVLVLLATARCGRGDLTCDQVKSTLSPCVTYVVIGWGPSKRCCNAVRSMVDAGNTTQDRRTICSCVKSAAAGYSDSVKGRAIGIPAKCGVSLSYQLSPTVDCDTIN